MEKLHQVVSDEDPRALYTKIKKIGQGFVVFLELKALHSQSVHVCRVSANIYLAKTLSLATSKKVVIKEMILSHQPRKDLVVNEILVMRESQHPNIVRFLESYLVNSSELWIVMEYMDGGALSDILENNTMKEDQISRVCFEVRLIGCGIQRVVMLCLFL
jgi:protein-serine/threonine kinase